MNVLNGFGSADIAGMYGRVSKMFSKINPSLANSDDYFLSAENSRTLNKQTANFSSQRLNSMKDKAIMSALSKRGYTVGQLNDMRMSDKVNLENAVINEAQNSVRNAVRARLMEENGGTITFLRGEQLSNEVVATLLFSV